MDQPLLTKDSAEQQLLSSNFHSSLGSQNKDYYY